MVSTTISTLLGDAERNRAFTTAASYSALITVHRLKEPDVNCHFLKMVIVVIGSDE